MDPSLDTTSRVAEFKVAAMRTPIIKFSDIEPGLTQVSGPYSVTEREIVEFAEKWDPRPIHTDNAAAASGPFGGLIASSSYTLAVRTRLLSLIYPPFPDLVATMGWNDLQLPVPLRPGDAVTLSLTWLDKRLSRSREKFGILRQEIIMANQRDEIVLRYIDTVGMRVDR